MMVKPTLKAALTRERRTNRRLRALLDDTTEQIRRLRHDLDLQFTRIAQLQAQLDARQGSVTSRTTSEHVAQR